MTPPLSNRFIRVDRSIFRRASGVVAVAASTRLGRRAPALSRMLMCPIAGQGNARSRAPPHAMAPTRNPRGRTRWISPATASTGPSASTANAAYIG